AGADENQAAVVEKFFHLRDLSRRTVVGKVEFRFDVDIAHAGRFECADGLGESAFAERIGTESEFDAACGSRGFSCGGGGSGNERAAEKCGCSEKVASGFLMGHGFSSAPQSSTMSSET